MSCEMKEERHPQDLTDGQREKHMGSSPLVFGSDSRSMLYELNLLELLFVSNENYS